MSVRAALALAALAVLAAPAAARSVPAAKPRSVPGAPWGAQDRPSEDEIFGGPGAEAPPPPPAERPEGPGEREGEARVPSRPEEAQLFGAPPAAQAAPPPPRGIAGRVGDEALSIGGQLYLRAASTALEDQEPGDWSLSSPNLLDLYVDARPNDRVRGFALGRTSFDPTLSAEPSGLTALLGAPAPSNPRVVLDQLWINFDLARRVFVTAGKQHVKWGVGRFWNPTDYLHRARRDPLAVFDPRTGITMVKAHVPWEARGWNLYGVAVLEELAPERPQPSTPSFESASGSLVSDVAVGGRAEVVLGTVELGADAIARDGRRPKFGLDVSAGVWDLDVYAEVALRTVSDLPRWRVVNPAAPRLDERFAEDRATGFTPAVVAGGTWSAKYSDEDVVTVGAEYFFDDSGYDDPAVYPFLLLGAPRYTGTPSQPIAFEQRDPAAFTPFYLGRHYAGAFVLLPSPGRWNDTSLTLSVLGNLTDKSAVARLDVSVLALTYLRVESYVAGHLGARAGEFRLGFTVPPQTFDPGAPAAPFTTPPIRVDPAVLELGVALRVSL